MSQERSSQEQEALIQPADKEEKTVDDVSEIRSSRRRKRNRLYRWCLFGTGIGCLIVGFVSGVIVKSSELQHSLRATSKVCPKPALRGEWRSLDSTQKRGYIRAVKCLKTKPSYLDLNQTLYDDFPWVHKHFGEYSHDAAPFLAWHRYFIHVYERTLQEQCKYKGHIPYWDWTLDWENITLSPVWDNDLGFGGNGNTGVGEAVFGAHCVTQGPFAGLEIPYFEHIYRPHCLMRGFEEPQTLSELSSNLTPKFLDELLGSSNYRALNLDLENGPHVAIPRSINGDFSLHTAPFDPVFFLHHTQLDRMWWRWQQQDPRERSRQYLGKAAYNSTATASLTDMMPMGGLAPDIKVLDIMSTESDLLCYKY